MAIEKWRPAKQGDVGFFRYRHSDKDEWNYFVCSKPIFDTDGCLRIGIWRFPICEVLVAYIDDTEHNVEIANLKNEVERLRKLVTELSAGRWEDIYNEVNDGPK